MAFPKEIPRRQRTGPGKLEKQLILFFVLYTDWLHTDQAASDPKAKTPIEELRRLLAPNVQETAFRRMLNRYLSELKLCGAVCWARVRKGGYCTSQFDQPVFPLGSDSPIGDVHLNRLARTAGLMRLYLDKEEPVGFGLGTYDRRFYSRNFFHSYDEAEKWYRDHFNMDPAQQRTIQRDMQAVWRVIRKMRSEDD